MPQPPPSLPAAFARPPVLRTLIRREFWEHRALWIAPLAVAAFVLIVAIIGKVSFDWNLAALPEQRRAVFGVIMAYAVVPQYITLGIIMWMYAADCLYTERKDRSILFWKSMPVSDTLTVLSKSLVVMVIVPLGVYLVSAVTTLLMSGIYLVRAWQDHAGGAFWDGGAWLRIQGTSLIAVVAAGAVVCPDHGLPAADFGLGTPQCAAVGAAAAGDPDPDGADRTGNESCARRGVLPPGRRVRACRVAGSW